MGTPAGFISQAGTYQPAIARYYPIGSNIMLHEVRAPGTCENTPCFTDPHQLTHSVLPRAMRTLDHGRHWTGLRALSSSLAVKNADSYTYFCIAARLAKAGFILHSSGNGEFIRYVAATKRDAVHSNSTDADLEEAPCTEPEVWPHDSASPVDIQAPHLHSMSPKRRDIRGSRYIRSLESESRT